MKTSIIILAVLIVAAATALAILRNRWQARSAELIARTHGATANSPSAAYSPAELMGLPVPVQRYFRAVLREGAPVVHRARLSWKGDFLASPEKNGWATFMAEQHAAVKPAGFVWDARMSMSGLPVWVRDAFADGAGSMHASILGVVTLMEVEGTPGIARGALQRYLAETVWYPTALLPSQGVVWNAIDDSSARATLSAGGTTVSLDFHFGPDGLVQRVFAADRPRVVDGREVPTPWQGRLFEYAEHGGMLVPMRGEVEWLLPEGPQVYWKGRIVGAAFN